jgi:hypothetical protein
VVGIQDAVQLVGASFGFCARLASGEVHCWGNNDSGNLGDGTTGPAHGAKGVNGRGTPGAVLTDATAKTKLTGAVDLWANAETTCARREDGVWCWGPLWRKNAIDGVIVDPCPSATESSCKGLPAIKVADTTIHRYLTTGMGSRCVERSTGIVACESGFVLDPRGPLP